MPDTVRTRPELEDLLPIQTVGEVSVQDLRDVLASVPLSAEVDDLLADKADLNHTHTSADLTDLAALATQAELDAQAAATTIALATKAAISHIHPISDVTNLASTLGTFNSMISGKASLTHTHSISDVNSLQATLDGKASTSHSHDDLTNATDAATPDTLAKRNVIGGIEFTVINAGTVSATTIVGTTVSGTSVTGNTISTSDGITIIGNSGTPIRVTDGDGATFMSVNSAGAITAPSITAATATLNGTNITKAVQIAALADPNADRMLFWDDSANAYAYLAPSTGLTVSGTNMTVRAASESQTGIAETATGAEVAAAADTLRYITPARLTSITTLGTIATGTWQATPIADAYIAAASTWNAKVAPTRAINTTAPLSGGGALSSDLTLSIAASSDSVAGSMSADHHALVDNATHTATVSTLVKRDASGSIGVGTLTANAVHTSTLVSTNAYWATSEDNVIEFNQFASGHAFQVVDADYGLAINISGGEITLGQPVVGGGFSGSQFLATAGTTSTTPLIAQGVASQSADLFQIKTSSATPFAFNNLGRAVMRDGAYSSTFYQAGQVGYLGGAVSTTSFVITGVGTNSYVAIQPNAESVRFKADGTVGFGTTGPTAKVDINSDILRLRTAKTPASATATGNQGDICWDANYMYVCTATNTWKRSSISTW